VTIRKVDRGTVIGGRVTAPDMAGIPRVLAGAWGFAKNMADRFNRELKEDRTKKLLKKLTEKFQ
jgi:phage gp16-like protein